MTQLLDADKLLKHLLTEVQRLRVHNGDGDAYTIATLASCNSLLALRDNIIRGEFNYVTAM